MDACKEISVVFNLDDDEKEIMSKAYDIMREVRNKFLTSDMNMMCESANEALTLMGHVMNGVKIIEPDPYYCYKCDE